MREISLSFSLVAREVTRVREARYIYRYVYTCTYIAGASRDLPRGGGGGGGNKKMHSFVIWRVTLAKLHVELAIVVGTFGRRGVTVFSIKRLGR